MLCICVFTVCQSASAGVSSIQRVKETLIRSVKKYERYLVITLYLRIIDGLGFIRLFF